MKIKARELAGAALDWAVAVCEGRTIRHNPMEVDKSHFWIWEETPSGRGGTLIDKSIYMKIGGKYSPSTCWSLAGPIIERELITVIASEYWDVDKGFVPSWAATKGPHGAQESYEHVQMYPTFMIDAEDTVKGNTPLIAAMRCYCYTKLGGTVDIPEELCS